MPLREPAPRTGGFRITGLDGLRAIAVVLVLVYHLAPGTLVGGYLGVDLFFVISGFLITSLLVRERERDGRVSLRGFWIRRARRLLPALAALVLVCSTAAGAIGGDALVKLGAQLVGAATFSSNWVMLADGTSYFDQTTPELFRNLWSLAVEEQFYVVWPLLLVLVLMRMPAAVRLVAVGALAAGSAIAMALLWTPDDATRVYYGTDTHFFGLAIGAFLALLAAHRPETQLGWPRAARRVLFPVGAGALAAILTVAAVLPDDAELAFRGGILAVSALAAIVIAALLVDGSPLGRLLDLAPLRWIGVRSYGLYLWHWPIWVLLGVALPDQQRDPVGGWMLGGGALVLTVAASALSFRFVEDPIRRRGFRATARAVRVSLRRSRRSVVAFAASVALVLGVGTGTTLAVLAGVESGETQQLIEAGQEALDGAPPTPPAPVPTTSPDGTPAPPQPAAGDEITAIGDSVMLAAVPTLQEDFPGISIDAVVSRQLSAAPDLIRAQIDAGTMRDVLVIALGTNGSISRETLDDIHEAIGPEREMVVVNAQAPRGWTEGVNRMLSEFAQSYRNVELANWHDAIQPSLNVLAGDQIHFGSAGATIFAATIEDALQRLAALPPLRDERDDLALPRPV